MSRKWHCLGFAILLVCNSHFARLQADPPRNGLRPHPLAVDRRGRPDAIATALAGKPIFRNAVRSVAFSPDGKLLAIGCGDGGIRLWNVEKQRIATTIKAHDNWAFDLAFTPSGLLVSGGGDDLVRLIAPSTGTVTESFHDHSNDLHGVAVSPNGEWLVTGSDDTRVVLRSLKTASVTELGKHEKQVTSVTISPDGKFAASSSRDQTVRLWDLKSQKFVRDFGLHDADVMSVAFSPDSATIVTGSYDRTVRTWDVATGKQLGFLPGHKNRVYAVLYSRDGKAIFTGGGDHTFRMFQVSDGKLLREQILSQDVADFSLTPDGKRLAAGISDGSVRFFAIDGLNARLLPEVVHILPEPPKGGAPPPPEPLTQSGIDDYLRQHQQIRVIDKRWSQTVADLNLTGDAFTVHLLKQVDEKQLRPDQAELRMRVIQNIEERRGKHPERLRRDEWGPMLVRTAVVDLNCGALEHVMFRWLQGRMREQTSDPEVRKALLNLHSRPPVLEDAEQQEWGNASDRIRRYIDSVLKPAAKVTPEQK